MNSHERNLFSEFERQLYVDLTDWREQVVEYTESRLGLAEDEIHRQFGDNLSSQKYEWLMNIVLSHVAHGYIDQIDPLVRQGVLISIRGNFVYDIYTKSEHDFEAGWLDKGSELRGVFHDVAVKDYIDEEILDTSVDRLTDELVRTNTRRYGAHIVLTEPVEIMPGGSEHRIPDCDALLVPLMYNRLNLRGYLLSDH